MGRKAYNTRNLLPAEKPSLPKSGPPASAPAVKPKRSGVIEWVKKREMARRLGMSPRKLDDFIQARQIPFRKYSTGMIRFNPDAVEKALAVYDTEAKQP